MSLWRRILDWATDPGPRDPAPRRHPSDPIRLPDEPFVFECRTCGKVFEARRMRASCPECDSPDVELMAS